MTDKDEQKRDFSQSDAELEILGLVQEICARLEWLEQAIAELSNHLNFEPPPREKEKNWT